MDEQNPEPQTNPNEPQNEPQTPSPNAEAAKYRKERNAAREERDGLRAQLDDRDRADIEKLAAEKLADPADLWLTTSIDAMRGEDGHLDVHKASREIDAILEARPHWAARQLPDLHQGNLGQNVDTTPKPSFGEALRSQRGE